MKCIKCNGEWTSPSGCSLSKCPFCGNILVLSMNKEECLPYEVLRGIVENFGMEVLGENRLSGMIGDLMYGDQKIVQIFKFAVTKQIGAKLLLLKKLDRSDRSIRIANLKLSFCEDNFLQKDIAYYVVDSFVYALGWTDEVPKIGSSIQKNEFVPTAIDKLIEYPEPICDKGIYAYRYKNGQMATAFMYEYAEPFSEGLALVVYQNKWAFINEKGKAVICSDNYIYMESFSEGLALVVNSDLYCGFIDKSGKEVIPATYAGAESFSEGLGQVNNFTIEEWDEHLFIDKTGKVVIRIDCNMTYPFIGGLALISMKNGKYGYIDKTGKFIIPAIYDDASSFYEELALVQLNNKYGFIDKTGKNVIPIIYDDAGGFSEEVACVKLNGKYSIIDKTGKEIVTLKYDRAGDFLEGLCWVGLNEHYGFINKTGKEVIPIKYNGVGDFSEDLTWVEFNERSGFIDKEGNEIIPMKYDDAGNFSEGLAWVELDGKYGFIDKTGKIVISAKYDEANFFSKGLARICLNGRYGFIDKTGKEVIPAIYDEADDFLTHVTEVCLNGDTYFIDRMGNMIE